MAWPLSQEAFAPCRPLPIALSPSALREAAPSDFDQCDYLARLPILTMGEAKKIMTYDICPLRENRTLLRDV
jgi:hypothetical protein